MSSFFTVPASQRKRKRTDDRAGTGVGKPGKRRGGVDRDAPQEDRPNHRRPRDANRDESISGSESEGEAEPDEGTDSEASSEEDENAADRRVRLAQKYLDNLRQEVDEVGFDAEDVDKDLIAQRLKEDVDEAKGRQFRLIASTLDFKNASQSSFRADTHTTTGVAICAPYAYTVSKDKTLIQWQLISPDRNESTNGTSSKKSKLLRRRPKQLEYVRGVRINASASVQHGHTGAILCVAASPDGKYIATGGADNKLIIWSANDLRPLKTFTTHRDSVLGLAFAPSSSQAGFGAQLFSASADRSLKTYSLAGEDSLAYVETLFGHQDHVVGVAALAVDQCVSVGARDRSARLWRVVDETQLKFLGDSSRNDTYQTGSLDCVVALPPSHFVTGSDSGAISLWSMHKKKGLYTVHTAHGVDEPSPLEDVTSESDPKIIEELKTVDRRRPIPRAITALVALPGTDVVLSGSWDGWIRAWKVSDDKRSLISMGVVGQGEETSAAADGHGHVNGVLQAEGEIKAEQGPVKGIINSLAVFERRKGIRNEFGGTKEGECQGLCIVAGTGKEHRLGRWMKMPQGKNGAVVLEVPLYRS